MDFRTYFDSLIDLYFWKKITDISEGFGFENLTSLFIFLLGFIPIGYDMFLVRSRGWLWVFFFRFLK